MSVSAWLRIFMFRCHAYRHVLHVIRQQPTAFFCDRLQFYEPFNRTSQQVTSFTIDFS